MPHWDIHCPQCGKTDDLSFPTHAAMRAHVEAGCQWCDGPLELMPSVPGAMEFRGFNALNHYGAKQTDITYRDKNGLKINIKEPTERPKGEGQR